MADFCKACTASITGNDNERNDLSGISTAEDTANGMYPVVLCETCGVIQVNHEGLRMDGLGPIGLPSGTVDSTDKGWVFPLEISAERVAATLGIDPKLIGTDEPYSTVAHAHALGVIGSSEGIHQAWVTVPAEEAKGRSLVTEIRAYLMEEPGAVYPLIKPLPIHQPTNPTDKE